MNNKNNNKKVENYAIKLLDHLQKRSHHTLQSIKLEGCNLGSAGAVVLK